MKISTIAVAIIGFTLTPSVLAADNIHPKTGDVKISTTLGWLGGESKEYTYAVSYSGKKMAYQYPDDIRR
ncbi:hypothetical protein Xmau_01240 [Xenorhabdus mauleonii]|uniref:Uncharacterized protein n=1 Tax=Xenorhabdus mauleonii TaxID=351675 RepID=A0A1I3KFG9_9GAMM|nr:hypothetical protein [Xenorhabdus mauleonii]PHM45035.1 hypothetical protein Xmau_01240 [Xenorhabdus mauleonii]SFI71249.1 hypothetical protein SAMN05421680_10369 [Xenorhabdus mauleonii]